MTIQYDVTEKDFINFNLYHWKTSKSGKKLSIFTLLLPLFMFVVMLWMTLRRAAVSEEIAAALPGHIVVAAVLALIFFVLIKLSFRPALRMQAKMQLRDGKSNDFIGEQTIMLHDDFILDENKHMSSRINYSAVEKIGCGYDCLFIYIGAMKAIILPLRCFADPSQQESFIAMLTQSVFARSEATKQSRKPT